MKIEKFTNPGRIRCGETVQEPVTSWRTNRKCRNLAKFKVNGQLRCTRHAQQAALEHLLSEVA